MVLEPPANADGIELEIRSDSKTVVDWISGHANHASAVSYLGAAQEQLRDWWSRGVDVRGRVDDWAIHIFREHNTEADAWAEKEVRGRQDESKVVWPQANGLWGSRMRAVATTYAVQAC